MSVSRLEHITKIGVEDMGDLADSLHDPDVLRLENLDTNILPPAAAIDFTRKAAGEDDANSYLPFLGSDSLRRAATDLVAQQSGADYDWAEECVISAGGLSGVLNVLLALLEPGDEVLMTDPTYVGLINRVRLAGGVPRFVPLTATDDGWRLDLGALTEVDPAPVAAALFMSPSMPSGAVFDANEWEALTAFCDVAQCWLIDDSAMERILFGGREVIHPARYPRMRERTITVGSASKEYRMIGWRVGWVVGPAHAIADVARVSISNVVCQTGIAMGAVATAIRSTGEGDGIAASASELEARHDLLLSELADYSPIPAHGGWSLLLDLSTRGIDAASASKRLLEHGKVAATGMNNWGTARCASYLRLVFSNESKDPPARHRRSISRSAWLNSATRRTV